MMLDNRLVIKVLEDRLNELGKADSYQFKIVTDVGETEKNAGQRLIQGIFGLLPNSNVKPIAGYTNIIAAYELQFIISTQLTNKHVESVNKIILETIKVLNSTKQTIGNSSVVFNIRVPDYADLETRAGFGKSMIGALHIDIDYSENAVSSTDVILKLNGVELKSARVRVLLEPSGAVNNISGISNTKTLLMKQTKFYEVSAPYITDPLCVQLQKDILNCDISKTYELTYIDGIAFTEESPYVSTVALFRTNDSTADKPKVAELRLVFTDADKEQTEGVQYYMALIDNPFDDNNVNTRYFENQNEQQDWFRDKVMEGAPYEQIKAPNINSLTITQQVYINNSGQPLTSVLNKNYAVIKTANAGSKYWEAIKEDEQLGGVWKLGTETQGLFSQYSETYRLNTDGTFQLTGTIIATISDIHAGKTYYSVDFEERHLTRYIMLEQLENLYNFKADYARFTSALSGNQGIEYFYYFIQSASVGAANQILLDLKLDTIQTFYFNPRLNISDCRINRACLERFVEFNQNEVGFQTNENTDMYIPEQTEEVAKRLTKRTVLSFEIDTAPNSALNTWIKNNVTGWKYDFFTRVGPPDSDGNQGVKQFGIIGSSTGTQTAVDIKATKYLTKSNEGTTALTNPSTTNKIEGALICICTPVYKRESNSTGMANTIQIARGAGSARYISINSLGMDGFKSLNNNNTRLFASKFSINPPFIRTNYAGQYTVENGMNALRFNGHGLNGTFFDGAALGVRGLWTVNGGATADDSRLGVMLIDFQMAMDILTEEYSVNSQMTFNKSDIVGSVKNWKFNPKLLSGNYRELNITFNGNSFKYDLQKLGKSSLRLSYSEALTPDITRGYFRIAGGGGLYIPETDENLTGLVYSNDQSLMVDNDKLSAMLAENKNFFLQQGTNMLLGAAKGAVGGAIAGGPVGAALGAGSGLASSFLNLGFSIDNMRNIPNDIKNANGNVVFNNLYTKLGPTVEEYDILENAKIILNDHMFINGFRYEKIGNPKNFTNIRKFFNFVQADLQTISGLPVSNAARDDMKKRFASGIRFWNSDNVQYELENYEKWLG